MKKRFFLMLSICLFIIFIQPSNANGEQKTDSKLLSDTLIALLNPAISQAVENYYGYQKSYDLFEVKILDISRGNDGEFNFQVKVQVYTFKEAHNPPYGKETIVLEVEPDKVKVTKFIHKGDEYEKTIEKFYDEAILDIRDTFKLNLESFKKLTYDQLLYKAEKQQQYKSLSDIVNNIIENEINTELKTPFTPYKNVITPVTFIKENKGYILFKKANGTNVIYEVSKSEGKWVVLNKERKQGKKMKNDLLWYM